MQNGVRAPASSQSLSTSLHHLFVVMLIVSNLLCCQAYIDTEVCDTPGCHLTVIINGGDHGLRIHRLLLLVFYFLILLRR